MLFIPFIICLLIYICIAFYGLKFQKLLFSFAFFYIGYYLSNLIFTPIIASDGLTLVISISIGLILGSYSVKLYKFSTFLLGFITTFLICQDIFTSPTLKFVFGIAFGLIMGYICIKFFKVTIILLTSIYGSMNIINVLLSYFVISDVLVKIVLTLILIFISSGYQMKTNKED